MVEYIKRDKSDIFGNKIFGFLFKNKKFLLILRVFVAAIFFYAILLGFYDSSKDNIFTTALFWSLFWPLFMVLTLPTLGRVFCGICPHGFIGQYITKFGLKKSMPKWMQNRFLGLLLLVIGWWAIYYTFSGVYKTPLGSALLFTFMTLLAFLFYFIYKDMSYCRYICPIGAVSRAHAKLSFTWLGSYKSACSECRTFDCAKACPHNLKPFAFDKKNSMDDCVLCMECSHVCEAISFKVKKSSFSMFGKFKPLKVEVWSYILILASIPIAMSFHHGIGRSNATEHMIWAKSAELLESYIGWDIDLTGMFALLYALLFSIMAATAGMYIASKILKKPFKDIFYNLGYSYAPLFIFGSLGHALSRFFTKGHEKLVEGTAWAFGHSIDVAPLATRGDSWLYIFSMLKWVAVAWSLWILYKRLGMISASKIKKLIAYPFAALLVIFFIGINLYRGYILETYGVKKSMHNGMHNKTEIVSDKVSPAK